MRIIVDVEVLFLVRLSRVVRLVTEALVRGVTQVEAAASRARPTCGPQAR
jgi:hypothetical protein